jgi:G3E family GTPase
MVGGFLGAGKTTTIARLAEHFRNLGQRVAIVTNDQTSDLVDTKSLEALGFPVGEVAGACFCCNFKELTETIDRLASDARPEVILAEPVGSCTDLVATVMRPLERVYGRPMLLSPYGVILKPSHGMRILESETRAVQARGFSEDAEYIFRKQLEEADFVILNRIDQLTGVQVDRLETLLEEQYPQRPIVRFSAKLGTGLAELLEQFSIEKPRGRQSLELDYDRYAAGEAELGWLNARLRLVLDGRRSSLEQTAYQLVESLRRMLLEEQAETAHLKAVAAGDGQSAVANLVSSQSATEISRQSPHESMTIEVVVNARVAIAPDRLEQIVREAVDGLASNLNAEIDWVALQAFRPGRPVPVHRMANA